MAEERTPEAKPDRVTVDAIKRSGRLKRASLRFALTWAMDRAALKDAHEFNYLAGTPFHPELHERNFRRELAGMHYGLPLNPDGSSYEAVDWEGHEKELACLSLKWPVTLALIVSDPASKEEQPFAAKCFRDGMVFDWNEETAADTSGFLGVASGKPEFFRKVGDSEISWTKWVDWPEALAVMTSRSPRPCPHPPEVEASPA